MSNTPTPAKPSAREHDSPTSRPGAVLPRQDSLVNIALASLGNVAYSPRADLACIFSQAVLKPLVKKEVVNNEVARRDLIRDALQGIIDIRSGRSSAMFGRQTLETELAINMIWEGMQTVLVNIAGGDLDFLTQTLNEFTEETLDFISNRQRWVRKSDADLLQLPLAKEIKSTGILTITAPLDNAAMRNIATGMDPAEAASSAREEDIQMSVTSNKQEITGTADGVDYVLTEPILPRQNQETDSEFVLSMTSRLLTTGPLAATLATMVQGKEKLAKFSTQLQPLWEGVIRGLSQADAVLVGNWLAVNKPEDEVPRAGKMIIQWAMSLINSAKMAEQVTSNNTAPMDAVIKSLYAQTEFFPEAIYVPGNDKEGTESLREFVMQMFNNVSRAGVLEALVSVIGNKRIEGPKGAWLKELTKVLRADGYDPSQNSSANPSSNSEDGKPLGHMLLTNMETQAVPLVRNSALQDTIATVFCGDVATFPKQAGPGILKLSLPQLMLLEPRKAKKPGRPALSMTDKTTTKEQRDGRLADYLDMQMDYLISQVSHANSEDVAASRGDVLNLQQRIAFMIHLWAHILSPRPNEPIDSVKERARNKFIGTMVSWYEAGVHQSEVVGTAIEEALRVIGLRWPDQSVHHLVQEVVNRGVFDGKTSHKNARRLAKAIALIDPDYTVNLGKAQKEEKETEGAVKPKGKKSTVTALELGIQNNQVFTAGRSYVVQAELSFLKEIARATASLGSAETRTKRNSILGLLGELNLLYEMNMLSENSDDDASVIALAYSLRQYMNQGGASISKELKPVADSVDAIINAARRAGVDYSVSSIRMGNSILRNPSRLPDLSQARDLKLDKADVARVAEYGRTTFLLSDTLMGLSMDIIGGYGNKRDHQSAEQIIASELTSQVTRILKTHKKSPHSYAKLLDAVQTRVRGIDRKVRRISKKMIGAAGALKMGDSFEASFADEIAKLKDKEPAKLIALARGKERELRDEMARELQVIFDDEAIEVYLQGQDGVDIVKQIFSAALSPLGIPINTEQVGLLLSKFTGSQSEARRPAGGWGDLLHEALMMVGAGGIGYTLGSAGRGHAVAAASEIAGNLTRGAEGISSEAVKNYAEAAETKRKVMIASLGKMYQTRFKYYQDMIQAATDVDATTIVGGLKIQQHLVEKQYKEAQETIDGVFALTKQLNDIQIQGLGLRIEEAQETLEYMILFMRIIRPIMMNIFRMADEQWGLNIKDAMPPQWESPETMLGITLPADAKEGGADLEDQQTRKKSRAPEEEVQLPETADGMNDATEMDESNE